MERMQRTGLGYARKIWILLIALITIVFGIPGTSIVRAAGPASIEFLNPSSFADGGSAGIVVSDRAATRPRNNPEGYRITAWTKNAPEDAGVEFEILSNGVSLETLDAVTHEEPDTFGYSWNIPDTLPDGPYTLRDTLFSENEAIDHADVDITILRLGDKASVDYPSIDPVGEWPAGGSFGTYRALAPALPNDGPAERGKPIGNIEASHTKGTDLTSGTTRVRAFYTTSAPGSAPKWTACGTEKTPGHPVPSSAANDGIRCTLASADDQMDVTAVAVLANSSPGEWEPNANAAGDAVRVFDPYAQVPSEFAVREGDGEVLEAGTGGGFPCHTVTARLRDQRGREIAGANVDVHATGPSDKLRLDLGLTPASSIKHADRHHSLSEPGHDCFGDSDTAAGEQSEHQILGGPDMKHGEADVDGTDDKGDWGFSFKVPAGQLSSDRYSVNMVMHVDEVDDGCHANDDVLTDGELFAVGSVGLGKAPVGTPAPTPPVVERCDRLPALRSITLNANRDSVREGGRVDFYGRIVGSACFRGQLVRLRSRNGSSGPFKTIRWTKTKSTGKYRFDDVVVKRSRDYRTKVLRNGRCTAARSRIVEVRATGR